MVNGDPLEELADDLRRFRPLGEAAVVERLLARLARRSAASPELRARLLADPKRLLADLGVACGPALEVHVHEAGPAALQLVVTADADEGEPPEHAAVLSRARQDASFADALASDPRAAFEAAGAPLPAGLRVEVYRNTAERMHVVLPPAATDELSDSQLDMAAGGRRPPPPPVR